MSTELIERDEFLTSLQTAFDKIDEGEGHCIFVSGEAGLGKTSLVKTFRESNKGQFPVFQGACDALFTPRPLAPLYDIMWQVNKNPWPGSQNPEDKSNLFAGFISQLGNLDEKFVIIFEDIHWADEATLDFIRFFARRISQLRCLFILTYRDDEVHSGHSLKSVFGQLPVNVFTRMKLVPLSRKAVDSMSAEKGYNGEDVYSVSGGNPFFVNEILASYSLGVPENVKDSILSVYHRQDEKTKFVWGILSILPTGLDLKYFENVEPLYADAVHKSLETTILILKGDILFFKHELYRRTVEASLSPLTRIRYNKKMLDIFLESDESNQAIERIVHLAKNANEYDTVVHYAPLAAKQAARVGAHIESARLYFTAIEYYQGQDKDLLLTLYEGYAYECYLTSMINEAITYACKTLALWKEKKGTEKIGNCLRFLSRLWWFTGNNKNATQFAAQAIEVLKDQPHSSAKAMAFSNMSQLKMLCDQPEECIYWGEKAMAIAKELNDEETLCHALSNVGAMKSKIPDYHLEGIELVQQSLQMAYKNSFHDHVARAYCNLAGTSYTMKTFSMAAKFLDEGIDYCEERDLNAYMFYLQSWKARLYLETGNWKQAYEAAEMLCKNENHNHAVRISALSVYAKVKLRRGEPEALALLLEAKTMAFETMELQRMIPVMIGLLEYEWLHGKKVIVPEEIEQMIELISIAGGIFYNYEFAFWLLKARKQELPMSQNLDCYDVSSPTKAIQAAAYWQRTGCPYMRAITLFEGMDDNKRNAITVVHELGATAVYEKMKQEMRISGIKKIPRGIRQSTRKNPALLTSREMDVLELLKEGLQNKEIASKLFISFKTVDNHITSLLFKLEVNSRSKAVAEATRQEII